MWGLGSYGRLGLGEPIDVPLPRRTRTPDFREFSQQPVQISNAPHEFWQDTDSRGAPSNSAQIKRPTG